MNGDPLLTAFVRVCSNGGAETLAVSTAVTVAGVCEAVPIEPGHVHLDSAHTVRNTRQVLAVGERSWPNLAWGKRGEVLLRGRVLLNNSNRKKESDETRGQKNVGQPLVEGGSDELRDGQQEAQPGKTPALEIKCGCPCIALRNMTRNTFVTTQVLEEKTDLKCTLIKAVKCEQPENSLMTSEAPLVILSRALSM